MLTIPRKANLIYTATVVVPIGALLWLGLQSFARQQQAMDVLRRERLAVAMDAETEAEARRAFENRSDPIVDTFFTIEGGTVVDPALYSPPPRPTPPALATIERLELAQQRPDLAAREYAALIRRHVHESLARQFLARSLAALGRDAEAKAQWHILATQFPDDRDLAGRPYGIVAAINGGETDGLFEAISAGRWSLSADQAEYFLQTLDPSRPSPFLDRYVLSRNLTSDFQPPAALRESEIYGTTIRNQQVFYRTDGRSRIVGFSVRPAWLEALKQRLAGDSNEAGSGLQNSALYGGAVAVMLLVATGGLVVLHRDISRERRLNELRKDFVNGVTHELKTPIAIIRLYGETLLQQQSLTETERRNCARVISRESARLGLLVDQVLTFARVERGEERYDLHEDDLAPFVSGLLDDYGRWLGHAGFTLGLDLPDSTPPVRFDSAAVAQAVVNLLDNAVKYSGESKRLTVRLAADAAQVTLAVHDDGIGIRPEDRGRIFEPFVRAVPGGGRGGYGLGLFIVRQIMNAHGGRVDLDSEPGRGSTFRLVFPVATS